MSTWYLILLLAQTLLAIIIFTLLFFIKVPYGRYATDTVLQHKVPLSARQGWLIMEVPAMCTILVVSAIVHLGNCTGTILPFLNRFSTCVQSLPLAAGIETQANSIAWGPLVFLGLWEVHYVYRGIVYPFLLSPKKNGMPLYVALSGAAFNIINGFINAWWLIKIKVYSIDEFYSLHFIIGLLLFFVGFITHTHSDRIMRTLKKSHSHYVVPQHFPHTIIAAPNYLGEIIQWTGWALATWSLAGGVFALFTIANLLPRAVSHLRWYRNTFADYPQSRKAIIPFVL